jgi:hypothetical protein
MASVGELKMVRLKQWFMAMVVGGMLLAGLTSCVVAPVEPGYVAPPPAVVIRPYPPDRYYVPYGYYRPYRPYYGWHPYGHRW